MFQISIFTIISYYLNYLFQIYSWSVNHINILTSIYLKHSDIYIHFFPALPDHVRQYSLYPSHHHEPDVFWGRPCQQERGHRYYFLRVRACDITTVNIWGPVSYTSVTLALRIDS